MAADRSKQGDRARETRDAKWKAAFEGRVWEFLRPIDLPETEPKFTTFFGNKARKGWLLRLVDGPPVILAGVDLGGATLLGVAAATALIEKFPDSVTNPEVLGASARGPRGAGGNAQARIAMAAKESAERAMAMLEAAVKDNRVQPAASPQASGSATAQAASTDAARFLQSEGDSNNGEQDIDALLTGGV